MNMLASQIKEHRDDIAEIQTTLSKSELARITCLGTYLINN
jgi:ribosomal protein L29